MATRLDTPSSWLLPLCGIQLDFGGDLDIDDGRVFYAHSTERADKSDWQLLKSHLDQVAARAEQYAAVFGCGPLARVAGMLHDVGKYTEEFQLRLIGQFGRVDHATWGARIACREYSQLGQLLAYGIAGHHAGLANGSDGEARRALQDRLRAIPELQLDPAWKQDVSLPARSDLLQISGFNPCKERLSFQQSMLGRMIFSCLVDADYLDTEEFYAQATRDSDYPGLELLRDKLNRELAKFTPNTPVNRWRAEILAHVREQAMLAPGLFSLTVPTGGGKTLASLAFALDHAIQHGLRRVIFALPFTTIVEQNAAVFRNAFQELGPAAVLEHHSAFVDHQTASRDARDKLHLAMENWDAPIIVTTTVQLFESLFADRPSRCRKLHNIAGSVVILDEAQTLPPKLLRPCVTALDELALNYRTSIVLCTATQPALKAEDEFCDGLKNVRELAPAPHRYYAMFKRVTVKHAGTMTQEALANTLREHDQALCIVNNRRHARALYQAIASEPGAYHLSTSMCAQHRSSVLRFIRKCLKRGQPCRVVATSLIEAGVDVDFPFVMRAESGLDSIAQAAGRCNREGRRPAGDSEVIVFALDSGEWAPPPELKQSAQVFREIYRLFSNDLLSLEAVREYFRLLYWQKGPLDLDTHDLLRRLQDSRVESLPFETLASKFRMIESIQFPIIVPFDRQARSALTDLAYVKSCGAVARRLQPYLVPVPRQAYDTLRNAGAVQPKLPEKYGEQFMELINHDLYDNRVGLTWDDPSFLRTESLYP